MLLIQCCAGSFHMLHTVQQGKVPPVAKIESATLWGGGDENTDATPSFNFQKIFTSKKGLSHVYKYTATFFIKNRKCRPRASAAWGGLPLPPCYVTGCTTLMLYQMSLAFHCMLCHLNDCCELLLSVSTVFILINGQVIVLL